MPSLVADRNVEDQLEILLGILNSDYWQELWGDVGVQVETFQSLGLDETSADSVIWQMCQQRQVILITANRNKRGADSLEATIQARNTSECLPVLTLADAARIETDKAYAGKTAESLLDYMMRIERLRGTGRLYLP
jgi:hypothetical protein